jgi:hypothetical protein
MLKWIYIIKQYRFLYLKNPTSESTWISTIGSGKDVEEVVVVSLRNYHGTFMEGLRKIAKYLSRSIVSVPLKFWSENSWIQVIDIMTSGSFPNLKVRSHVENTNISLFQSPYSKHWVTHFDVAIFAVRLCKFTLWIVFLINLNNTIQTSLPISG